VAVTSPGKSMVASASKGRGIGRGNFYVKTNNRAHDMTVYDRPTIGKSVSCTKKLTDCHGRKPKKLELKCLPNIHHTQAPEITPRQGRNGAVRCCTTLFAASAYHSYAAGGNGSTKRVFVAGDLDL